MTTEGRRTRSEVAQVDKLLADLPPPDRGVQFTGPTIRRLEFLVSEVLRVNCIDAPVTLHTKTLELHGFVTTLVGLAHKRAEAKRHERQAENGSGGVR